MSHTEASLLGIVVTVVLDLWILRTRLLTRSVYWASYAIVLFFQLRDGTSRADVARGLRLRR